MVVVGVGNGDGIDDESFGKLVTEPRLPVIGVERHARPGDGLDDERRVSDVVNLDLRSGGLSRRSAEQHQKARSRAQRRCSPKKSTVRCHASVAAASS